MKVGVWLPCYRKWVGREEARRVAQAAEGLGFGSLWVQDHLVAPTADTSPVDLQSAWLEPDDYGNKPYNAVEYFGSENFWLDPYATWGFLAGCTETIELGSCIVVLPYRDPIAQAKMLGTLDVLSGGRMVFGAGAGHVKAEFDALHVPYKDRGRITDEYLDVMSALLRGEEVSWSGEHFEMPAVLPLIASLQQPRPPFLIGGGSKVAVRRSVERGDGWFPAHLEPDGVKVGLDYMKEYAEKVEKQCVPPSVVSTERLADPRASEVPGGRRAARTADEMRARLAEFAELGVERMAIDLPGPNVDVLLRQMELLAAACEDYR
jgi:probable F420-dependent oxidoreductase